MSQPDSCVSDSQSTQKSEDMSQQSVESVEGVPDLINEGMDEDDHDKNMDGVDTQEEQLKQLVDQVEQFRKDQEGWKEIVQQASEVSITIFFLSSFAYYHIMFIISSYLYDVIRIWSII